VSAGEGLEIAVTGFHPVFAAFRFAVPPHFQSISPRLTQMLGAGNVVGLYIKYVLKWSSSTYCEAPSESAVEGASTFS